MRAAYAMNPLITPFRDYRTRCTQSSKFACSWQQYVEMKLIKSFTRMVRIPPIEVPRLYEILQQPAETISKYFAVNIININKNELVWGKQ